MRFHGILGELLRSFNLNKGLSAVVALSLCLTNFPLYAEGEGESADSRAAAEIVEKYVNNLQAQQENLRGVAMEVEINADLPKLHKTGKMNALRMISKVGKVSYKMLGFSGDTQVKNDVIARYLTAETQSQLTSASLAITPANYKFKLKGSMESDGQKVFLLEVRPRQKRVGLFKGDLWIDAKTYLPVRESGTFVKTPSVFLKKVEFTRNYEIHDGVAVPKHIQSTVDTRIVGKADITIDFSDPKHIDPDQIPVEEARVRE